MQLQSQTVHATTMASSKIKNSEVEAKEFNLESRSVFVVLQTTKPKTEKWITCRNKMQTLKQELEKVSDLNILN